MTLIELVIAIAVISISLSGTLMVVNKTTRASADPMLERQSISIAESYLEEIAQKSFLDPDLGTLCPPSEASRSAYDNVCDYDGLNDVGAKDQLGSAVTGLENYRIEVDVDTSANLGTISASTDVVRVDVLVIDPLGRELRVSSYRTGS